MFLRATVLLGVLSTTSWSNFAAQTGDASCVTRTFTNTNSSTIRYKFTNNCSVCVRMVLVALKNGSPRLPGEMLGQPTAPGADFIFIQSITNELGTFETKVIRIESCPSPPAQAGNSDRQKSPARPVVITTKPSEPVGRLMVCDNDGTHCRTPPQIEPNSNPPKGTATITPMK